MVSRYQLTKMLKQQQHLQPRTTALTIVTDDPDVSALSTIVGAEDCEIVDFEVFEHYMAVLEAKGTHLQLRTMLLSAPHKQHLHFFDQAAESAASDGKVVPYLDVAFTDNYTFDDSVLRCRLAAPN